MLSFIRMNDAILTLEHISVSYEKGNPVLNDLSLSVFGGRILGIRGENGAGKSTLLRVMAGIQHVDAGQRRIAADVAKKIAYVPQEIALYPALTGRQNLDFWAEIYGLRGAKKAARIRSLLHVMELDGKANKRVETYSGGMKRRLNLACALVASPKLLLLDEPTVGADVRSVGTMQKIILDTAAGGTGVVLISHQAGEIEQLCDRILTLQNGCFAEKRAFCPETESIS